MPKNLFAIALLLITFFKNINAMKPKETVVRNFPTLYELCLYDRSKHISGYAPEQLFELAKLTKAEKALPQEIAYEISKALITKNSTLFFPKVDGYPKIKQISQHNNAVSSAVFSPDGQFILTASYNTANLWNLNRGPIATFHHDFGVESAVFSPDGQFILTASGDDTAKLWDLNGGEPIATFQHDSLVESAVFSPDGQFILTASADHTAKLWNLNGGEPITIFQHGGLVFSAVFSPDGQSILTASYDHTAKLWNLNGGEPIATFQHDFGVNSAVFSPDGQSILTASYDHTTKLWNLNGEPIATFQHNDFLRSAVFSPDGQSILTASNDYTAKLWNLNGEPIATFQHGNWVRSAVFSPDGQFILTASDDNTAKLWEIHPLWNSPKYRNGQLSLPELAVILLILKYKDFVKSNPEAQAIIHGVLNQIDGNVPDGQRHIKNFFEGFLNS